MTKIKTFRKKNGFTLVETIVAMSLVVIISLIAYSVINVSISTNQKNKKKSFFISETQNYVKAYTLGEDDYETSMFLITGRNYQYGEDTTIYYSKDYKISNTEDYAYYVNLNFYSTNFLVECFNSKNVLIYSAEV